MWLTYLFVAGSIILLKYLSMINKTWTNFSNEEIWRLLLLEQIRTLLKWMTKALGRIIEKEISSPDICCRNVQIEMNHVNITHTWCSSVFARSLNKAIRQKPSITQYELRKTSIKFLVASLNNPSCFHSYLRTPIVYHRMDKSCFNSHCQKNFFSKSCSPVTKFPRIVILFHFQNIGSCDPE